MDRELLKKKLQDRKNAFRDARQRKNTIKPLENYSVVETMKELIKDKTKMSKPKLDRKYLQLHQEYPQLYEMALSRNMSDKELELLETMINTRESMRDGTISEKDAKDLVATSTAEIFAPHILKPQLPNEENI